LKRELELFWVDEWDIMLIELMQQGQLVPNPIRKQVATAHKLRANFGQL